MLKLKDYLRKTAIIYEDTPMFPSGGVVIILDYDSISKGEPSFLVTENIDESSGAYAYSVEKWVTLSDIKQIVSFSRPKEHKYITKFKNLIREVWIRVSKIL